MIFQIIVPVLTLGIVAVLSLIAIAFIRVINGRRKRKGAAGFFHPYTNDGGGGERVLWSAIKSFQEEYPAVDCVIYSGDHDISSHSLVARAIDRFGIQLLSPPKVVHLRNRKWIEESNYPHFTLIGQSFGSIYLAWEALSKLTPVYYVDTSGYAFTYPLARMFGCKVMCYTHYPTISSDMISRVRDRSFMYNNGISISQSTLLSRCKIIYYTIFSWMYGFVGSCAHLVMVNSSWTQSHIEKLWQIPNRIKLVYPPCDTRGLQKLPLERPQSESPTFISVGQFRPEKAHLLQLKAFSIVVHNLHGVYPKPKLKFVGSCRNQQDKERLRNLQQAAKESGIDGDVEFFENVPYSDLMKHLGSAIAGIHSMIDEHFGISVVEYMAAGAIPIAHNSAGPKMDIVKEEDGVGTGFLAETVGDFSNAMLKVLRLPDKERLVMASAARKRAALFADEVFYKSFRDAICHL